MEESLIMTIFMLLSAIGVSVNESKWCVVAYSVAFGIFFGLFIRFICKGVT